MRKKWRRWGAGLLAGLMVVSAIQTGAYADVRSWIPGTRLVATPSDADKIPGGMEKATPSEADEISGETGELLPEDHPTATGSNAALAVAAPTAPVMFLAASQTVDLSKAATVITIDQNGDYIFTGTWADDSDHTYGTNGQVITVKSGVKADITFQNVTITKGAVSGFCSGLHLESGAEVTLTLDGVNQIATNAPSGSAIHVPSGASLTIEGDEDAILVARARSYGAGIGGNKGEAAGTIKINSGKVYASSGYRNNEEEVPGLYDSGAGIGGGVDGGAGTVEISGGAVMARSAKAAGIGAGGRTKTNQFQVHASSEKARIALRGDTATDITVAAGESQIITDSGNLVQVEYGEVPSNEVFEVTSEQGPSDGIEIRPNGSVTLSGSGPYTISMRDPYAGAVSNTITIESNCTVRLNGVKIDASSQNGNGTTGISPIEIKMGLEQVTLILEGENYLVGGQLAAAISNWETPLVIKGDGKLTARAGIGSAAIGGNYEWNGRNITIAGGDLTIYGVSGAACLGGGSVTSNTNGTNQVTISGGTVRLIQEEAGYLLGGENRYGQEDEILISGGEVTGIIDYQGDQQYRFLAKISRSPIKIQVPNGKMAYLYAGETSPGTLVLGATTETTHTFSDSDGYMKLVYGEIQTHTLTVNEGTITDQKSGYLVGEKVSVQAEKEKNGRYFSHWEVKSGAGSFEDPSKEKTTFTMGDQDTVVEAVYQSGFKVTVNRGTSISSGTYKPGTQIMIQADDSGELRDAQFAGWILESGSGNFQNASSRITRFTVGNEDAVITALFSGITGDFVVTGGRYGYDYTYTKDYSGRLTITGNGTYDISLKKGISDTSQQILIQGGTPTLTLHDIRVNAYCAMEIRGADATLILDGENSLTSEGLANGYPEKNGIAITQGGSLAITSIQGDGSLEGSLYAKATYVRGMNLDRGYAGIGGAGQIMIKGGTIYAEGSKGAPGIGSNAAEGAAGSSVVNISITGGQVTAVGNGVPGIGNGTKQTGVTLSVADNLQAEEGDSEDQLVKVSSESISKAYVKISAAEEGNTPTIRISNPITKVYRGERSQFQAVVFHAETDSVIWSVEGCRDHETTINRDGLLHVGTNETAQKLTIMAKLEKAGIFASAEVSVGKRSVSLSLDQAEISFGESVVATAEVSEEEGQTLAGKIRFYLDGAPVSGSLTLQKGKTSFTILDSLLSGGTHQISAEYVNGSQTERSKTLEILVKKAAVTVSVWPTYEETEYLQKQRKNLTVKTNGSASAVGAQVVTGTFRFKEENGYPEVGTNSYQLVFVPTYNEYYEVAEGTVQITVIKANLKENRLSLSVDDPCYGQKVGSLAIDATSGQIQNTRGDQITGSWQWKDPDQTVSQKPGQMISLNMVYKADDQKHYNDYEKPVTVPVQKAEPKATWHLDAAETCAGKEIPVSLEMENPYTDSLRDVPEPSITYQIGTGQVQSVNGGIIHVPEDVPAGTVITVKAATAENDYYRSWSGIRTIRVVDRKDISSQLALTIRNCVYGENLAVSGSISQGTSDGTGIWSYEYRAEGQSVWDSVIPKQAGTYQVKGIYQDESQIGETIETFQIIPKTLTIVDGVLKTKTYDGTRDAEVLSVKFSGMVEGETIQKDDYEARAVFDDAEAGDGKRAVLYVQLKQTSSMANYVLNENQFVLTGQRIQKPAATPDPDPKPTPGDGGNSGESGSGTGGGGNGSGNSGGNGNSSRDREEYQAVNADRSVWILNGKGWRLRRADRTYARGKVISQSLKEGMKVKYQWELVNGRWYAFDEKGYLKTGLFYDGGYDGWFYVDENEGMAAGWKKLDSRWYYFKEVSDGTRGIMLKDQKTPDGYYVDGNGEWKP